MKMKLTFKERWRNIKNLKIGKVKMRKYYLIASVYLGFISASVVAFPLRFYEYNLSMILLLTLFYTLIIINYTFYDLLMKNNEIVKKRGWSVYHETN